MTKYYRVRSRQQWDWLMQWFENENKNIKWVNGSEKPSNSKIRDSIIENGVFVNVGLYIKLDVYNSISYGYDTEMHMHDYIEVSQMMEDEKMEDYVTMQGEDLKNIEMFRGDESKGNLREFWDISKVNIPKSLLYPKVRMSVAEKKEFDELKRHRGTVYGALDMIEDDYPKLYTRLFGNSSHEGDNKAQLEFARAWADPSLIEVIPDKKWNVRVPISCNDAYYNKVFNEYKDAVMVKHDVDKRSLQIDNNFKFTAEEIKYYHLDNDLFEKVEVKE